MWKITDNKRWSYLKDTYEWIRDMQHVQQDPEWHGEGNVENHTISVIQALEHLLEKHISIMPKQDYEILWAAALLHDVEKRSTTQIDPTTGRLKAPGHAKKGESTSRTILYRDIPTPFDVREKVCKLVRHHGMPLFFAEQPDYKRMMIKGSLDSNMMHIAMIASADVMGRICQDEDVLIESIEFFSEMAIELGCYDSPYPFKSGIHRYEYINTPDRALEYIPYDDYKNQVFMMSGLPGSGKDTYIKQNFDLPVVSLDDLRKQYKVKPDDVKGNGKIVQAAKELAKTYLRKHQPFVLNSTNVTRQMREIWINMFTEYKAKTTLIYREVPYKELISQNNQREEAVPMKVIDKLINKLEVPSLWEAHKVEYRVKSIE